MSERAEDLRINAALKKLHQLIKARMREVYSGETAPSYSVTVWAPDGEGGVTRHHFARSHWHATPLQWDAALDAMEKVLDDAAPPLCPGCGKPLVRGHLH